MNREIYMGHDNVNQGKYNLVQWCKKLFNFHQGDNSLVRDYMQDLKNYLDVYKVSRAFTQTVPKAYSRAHVDN